jgi:hypothetical protein
MNLELTEEQAAALEKELRDLIDADSYFLSPRVQTLREILYKIRPEPEPLPPPRHYAPRPGPDSGDRVRTRLVWGFPCQGGFSPALGS